VADNHDVNGPNWERRVLEKVAMAGINEQRKSRRWGIFFKLLGFVYLTLVLGAAFEWWGGTEKLAEDSRHTALINLQGVISAKGEVNADDIIGSLQAAFEDKGTAGVIIRINSPGGSPVQSGMINDEMRRLRKLHADIPLYVVVEDICASGGYYIAAQADKIFVDKASIVGSIGVLMDGFGFTGTMDKLGVERRLLTAGENKGFLDPFSPANKDQQALAKVMLGEIHEQFVEVVRHGRGKRLKETPEMFSGLMWSGAKSIEMGLADDYGTVDSVARDIIGEEEIHDYTVKPNFAERVAERLGASVGTALSTSVTHAIGQIQLR
jgi:protease IV